MAVEVWDRLADDPTTCRELALAMQIFPQISATNETLPSRGPEPCSGEFTMIRTDGRVSVYVMMFEANGIPVRQDKRAVLKIGMSSDLVRREVELNHHLPTVLGLRWRPLAAVELPTAYDAWRVEQAVLRHLGEEGRSLGFEFALDDETRVVELLERIARDLGGSR